MYSSILSGPLLLPSDRYSPGRGGKRQEIAFPLHVNKGWDTDPGIFLWRIVSGIAQEGGGGSRLRILATVLPGTLSKKIASFLAYLLEHCTCVK